MTDSAENRQRQRHEVRAALEKNRARRRKLEWELEQARDEVARLLARGLALPWPLKLAEMARDAEISRETAYKALRRLRRESDDG